MIDYLAGGNIFLVIAIKLAICGGVYLAALSVIVMFSIWWERKVAGHIQSRVGPMHVGLWHGWAQSLADGVKLIFKEDLVPGGADSFLFRLAPYIAFAPVFAAMVALPFGPQFIFEDGLNIGVLYVLAFLAVEIMAVILAGWASNSKWSIYGAMREACQMVSYEIPLACAILTGVLVAGTLDMVELGYLQAGGMHEWIIFHSPFVFIAFIVYFIASLASNKRAPFDLPESESELVAGFHTEYSGLRWSFFFFAEYGAMFIVGVIQAALFMGGWNSPFGSADPVYMAIGYDVQAAAQAFYSGAIDSAVTFDAKAAAINAVTGTEGHLTGLGLVLVNLYGVFWIVAKAMTVIWIQIWLRWTLPRIRIDQVLHVCIKVLLPIGLVTLIGTAVWIALVPQPEPGYISGSNAPVTLSAKYDAKGYAKITLDPATLTGDKVTAARLMSAAGEADVYVVDGESKHFLRVGSGYTLGDKKTELLVAAPWADSTKPEKAADEAVISLAGAFPIQRTGHLLSHTPWLQAGVQVILMLVFIAVCAGCVAIMAAGWMGILFKDKNQPRKTLFDDIMPVGDSVAFTTGEPVEAKAG